MIGRRLGLAHKTRNGGNDGALLRGIAEDLRVRDEVVGVAVASGAIDVRADLMQQRRRGNPLFILGRQTVDSLQLPEEIHGVLSRSLGKALVDGITILKFAQRVFAFGFNLASNTSVAVVVRNHLREDTVAQSQAEDTGNWSGPVESAVRCKRSLRQ